MDGITLRAVAVDLKQSIIGARIEKIYQPEKDELLLYFRSGKRLLLSANASHARVQLTELTRNNPAQPPMFCMLLRKHLMGARVSAIHQPNFERVLQIDFLAQDEMGYETTFSLITETMGKHSNIIFIRNDQIIIDSIKHIPPSISSVRYVMPGLKYESPPAQNKRNPLLDHTTEIQKILLDAHGSLDQLILQNWSGFAPAFAREAALRCHIDGAWEAQTSEKQETAITQLNAFFDLLRNADFSPIIIVNTYKEPVACFPFVSVQYDPQFQRPCENIHQALDQFYALRDQSTRIKQKGANLHRTLQNNIERNQKKLALQHNILTQTSKMESDKLYGELLTANAHAIPRGTPHTDVINYYDEQMPTVRIPLDVTLSGVENAQRYYKRYRKARAAYEMAEGQIKKIQSELNYLEGQIDNLEKCTQEDELLQIHQELVDQGFIRADHRTKSRKVSKIAPTKPLHYRSSDGADIYVGKNNIQNDQLTLRMADSNDLWLHTKDIPGSHVIIKQANPSEQTINEAAQLAAYYSKGRNGSQIPVDYTLRRHIKKPNGSPPGFVIYSTNQTAYITPDESLIQSLVQL